MVINEMYEGFASAFQTLQPHGNGSRSELFSATTLKGEKVIIRQVKVDVTGKEAIINAIREISILRACNHPNIIKPQAVFTTICGNIASINIVFPRLMYSVTYFNLPENRPLWCDQYMLPRIQNIIFGVLSGLRYLHRNGIVHRNIGMNNVMLDNLTNATIIDFGLSRDINRKMTQLYVPRRFAAPESTYFAHGYTEKSDLWSVGCMLVELLVGENIRFLDYGSDYELQNTMVGLIQNADIPGPPDDSEELNLENVISMVKKLVVIDVSQRYDAEEALSCSFFGDWEQLEYDNDKRIVDDPDMKYTFEAVTKHRRNPTVLKKLLFDIGQPTTEEREFLQIETNIQ